MTNPLIFDRMITMTMQLIHHAFLKRIVVWQTLAAPAPNRYLMSLIKMTICSNVEP